LGWGIADFLGGLTSRSAALLSVLLISQVTALVLLAAIVIVLAEPAPDARFILYAAISGLSEVAGVAALYRGLAIGVMSIVAPIAAIAPVVPLAFGLAFGEVPAPIQGAGLALIIVGVVLTSRQRRSNGQARGRLGASIVYGLLSALGFGIFFVALGAASGGDIPWALLTARLTAVTAIGAAIVASRFRFNMPATGLPATASIGALIIAADFMYATATTLGLLSVVAVLGALHTVVTIGLARVYLRERLERLQQLGIAACFCGVLIITGS
jgi:drug/metabolite transporter (DMT)-like permease